MQLHSICKREHKSFKEYAQRWRDLAAHVAPPMTVKAMITIIVDTLPVFYYEKMVGYAPSSFADLVFADKRIEAGLKRGKFDHPTLMSEKARANEEDENEGETLAMTAIPTRSNFPSAQQCHYSANNSPSHPIIHKGHPQSSIKPARHTSGAKTPTKKKFFSKKACRIHPKFRCHMLTCSHIYLIMQW